MVLLSIGLTLAAPWLTSHDPLEIADASLSPPSSQYLLGTDQLGRDVLTRILYAARSSLAAACLSAALAFVSGTMIGLIAGYSSGPIDACLMRVLDVLQAFPALLLAIALVAALGPNLPNLVLTMGLLFMPRFARVARASTLSVRERDYIAAAVGLGVSRARTLYRHVLPNIAAPLIVEASLTVTIAILTEASLSFLGLGVQPPDPTWGGMIAESTSVMALAPWLALSPGFAIVFVVVGFTLMGDGLRDALDPTRLIDAEQVKDDAMTELPIRSPLDVRLADPRGYRDAALIGDRSRLPFHRKDRCARSTPPLVLHGVGGRGARPGEGHRSADRSWRACRSAGGRAGLDQGSVLDQRHPHHRRLAGLCRPRAGGGFATRRAREGGRWRDHRQDCYA